MTVKTAICSTCKYPLQEPVYDGQNVTCPYCNSINVAIAQGVTIPTWLLTLGIGLTVGIIAGPALLASTESGSQWLEKQVRERVR